MSIPTRQEILFRNKTIILVLYFILACILSECNDFHRTIVKFPKIIQEVVTKKGNSFLAIALLFSPVMRTMDHTLINLPELPCLVFIQCKICGVISREKIYKKGAFRLEKTPD